jgi:ferrochelatase
MTNTERKKEQIAVVLLNLGGPEKLADVRPFLYNLFSDRQIIRLGPSFMQKPLAWMIARRRASKSQGYYEQIGGGSPLNKITAEQCAALENNLRKESADFKVFMAMRYWQPFAKETLDRITSVGITKIIALTLYPHYSIATTGSSLFDLKKTAAALQKPLEIIDIEAWPDQPKYINCLSTRILGGLGNASEKTAVVYSAHSLPVKFIQEGDPYVEHLKKTIQAIEEQTHVQGHLCFQSRSGPVEWLSPSTPDMLEQLAGEGCKRILMVPISFVSDHVETLCEIDIQYREQAESLGMYFARTPSLNTDPRFIAGLAELVRETCQKKGW